MARRMGKKHGGKKTVISSPFAHSIAHSMAGKKRGMRKRGMKAR